MSILRRLFKKHASVCEEKIPPFEERVADEIYSKDKKRRFVIRQTGQRIYRLTYEVIYVYEEDGYQEEIPSFWVPAGNADTGIYDSVETARREIYATPEYKMYFADQAVYP